MRRVTAGLNETMIGVGAVSQWNVGIHFGDNT